MAIKNFKYSKIFKPNIVLIDPGPLLFVIVLLMSCLFQRIERR